MVDRFREDIRSVFPNSPHTATVKDSTVPFQFPSSPVQVSRVDFTVASNFSFTSLDFDHLHCFDVVDRQFQRWGVTFSNAIALAPSNPAFSPSNSRIVLMGGPQSGWIEARFHIPVCHVRACVTGSRPTVLTAFDRNNAPIGQVASPGANLSNGKSSIPPNLELSIRASSIHRIMVHAFDGQFIIDQFSFQ